jgi:hypothetical protein
MDRIKETADLIIKVNKFRQNELADYELVTAVCTYFDHFKDEKINQPDLRFLRFVAGVAGIPHFYDVLAKFDNEVELEEMDLSTISTFMYESTLHTSDTVKVHRYQKIVLDKFEKEKRNRYFLSASTSFGKTHVVYEVLKKMEYTNVVLIFPTIALLSENLERIMGDLAYAELSEVYQIHTLSEIVSFGKKNLFIYTPERFLSYLEKNSNVVSFDFVFIDEVYKIDNDYIIDEEVKENERDVAYRLALYYSLKPTTDLLFAGPYINFSDSQKANYNPSFDNFIKSNNIEVIDLNRYEIVTKSYTDIKSVRKIVADEKLDFDFDSVNKEPRLIEIIKRVVAIGENTIVYCSTRAGVESYAKKIIASEILANHDFTSYQHFVDHITNNFSKDWVVITALKNGIGIHHGLVPKYIQKEIINLFNLGALKVLISTTTITEGVNTSAKNLIVLQDKKGTKPLKRFDAKNIAGRAGRFLYHYSGRVLVLQNNFMQAINSEEEGIKHKNYDLESPKDEIDLYYTHDIYLKDVDKTRIVDIQKEQESRQIPNEVFEVYKVVSRMDKITVYDNIKKLNTAELKSIKNLIRRLNFQMDIDYDGFEVILKVIRSIVKNQKLIFLIDYIGKSGYATLTNMVHFYLTGGFIGLMKNRISSGNTVDIAIRDTAEFVYSTLKYQVVKYLGVFNIMYKFYESQQTNSPMADIPGIDILLIKLEYNALTEIGRIASDYGVPANVVTYYETENNQRLRANFDNYENIIFNRIDEIIQRSIRRNE